MLATSSQFSRLQKTFILHRQNLQMILQKYRVIALAIIGIVLVLSVGAYFFQTRFATSVAESPNKEQTTHNLRALAKLYGYVRYFHPSDEAAGVDWDRFLLYAIDSVKNARNHTELQKALEGVFKPIAPTIRIVSAQNISESLANDEKFTVPPALVPFYPKRVAWQYSGLNTIPTADGIYKSIRTDRAIQVRSTFGVIFQEVNAEKYRGKEIRLTGALKKILRDSTDIAKLRLRVLTPTKAIDWDTAAVTNQHRISDTAWHSYEISGVVDTNARAIIIGASLKGFGSLSVDNMRLFVRALGEREWKPVELINADFENGIDSSITQWTKSNWSFRYALTRENSYNGSQYLRISKDHPGTSGRLFSAMPDTGECISKIIYQDGQNTLRCIVPLVLPAHDSSTYSPKFTRDYNAAKGIASYNAALKQLIKPTTDADVRIRYANVIMVWNIFQHFYPYFDVVKVDWEAELTKALERVKPYAGTEDFITSVSLMVAAAHDGHAAFGFAPEKNGALGYAATIGFPSFSALEIDSNVVVVASLDNNLRPGDIIVSIDGKKSAERMNELKRTISGTPQVKSIRALTQFAQGKRGSIAYLSIKRGGKSETEFVNVYRSSPTPLMADGFRHETIDKVADNVYYVDLNSVTRQELENSLPALASAKGVILDMRRYPRDHITSFIAHLIDKPVQSQRWNVPLTLYPDQERTVGYDTSGRWDIAPKAPRLQGKIVFLTGGNAISYAESVMGIIEYYKLGEIVGEATAGTNGGANKCALPGGFMISWTGMKVLKHDGSQHHLVGIQPTVVAKRTIQGIAEGKDEVFEKALSLIHSSK